MGYIGQKPWDIFGKSMGYIGKNYGIYWAKTISYNIRYIWQKLWDIFQNKGIYLAKQWDKLG